MHDTFEQNLQDAEDKEAKSLEDYLELKGAKGDQLGAAEEALSKMDGENGAKAMPKEDAESERDALSTQRTNDEKFIEATASDLATKKEEWKAMDDDDDDSYLTSAWANPKGMKNSLNGCGNVSWKPGM